MFREIKIPSRSRRRRTVVLWLAAAFAAGAFYSASPARACWFDPIIFDPQNFAQRVMQFQQLLQEVSDAKTEITNQLHTLASLKGSIAVNPAQQVQQLTSQLQTTAYRTQDQSWSLQSQYPLQATNLSSADYQNLQQQWTQSYRQALVENRQVQDAVYQQMKGTSDQVQQIVTASNAAPGETAAIQAHNDLLAVLSSQLAGMQTLRTTRLRAKVEKLARMQSEDAYVHAQGQAVLQGLPQQPQTTSSVVVFRDGQ